VRSPLSIFTYTDSEPLTQWVSQFLSRDRYTITPVDSTEEFLHLAQQQTQQIDCLIVQDEAKLLALIDQLHQQGTFFPLVIVNIKLDADILSTVHSTSAMANRPHSGETASGIGFDPIAVRISITQLCQIAGYIDRAITQFIHLSPKASSSDLALIADTMIAEVASGNLLLQQQHRLAEKLRERLGYLGVYYKRNPQNFFRNFSSAKKEEFMALLKSEYRQIVVNYFIKDALLNQKIDNFVNVAFFSDISVTQIVEIHMDLMDDLSKQLKLEGRSDEVLLDYRLTLIDVISHLCEMYRRSIPRDS
jgi:circadian clock protein KaiA